MASCLQSLQRTNPELLLTAQQLKVTERDTRYIPAVSAAIASVVCKSRRPDLHRSVLRTVQSWSGPKQTSCGDAASGLIVGSRTTHNAADLTVLEVTSLGPLIEKRLHLLCSEEAEKKSKRTSKRSKRVKTELDAQDTQQDAENCSGWMRTKEAEVQPRKNPERFHQFRGKIFH